jgi:protein-L-isoaspartate(D-aspartate) O-methyltransferase
MPDRACDLRRTLVAGLRESGMLSDPRVEAAFLAVARERFLAAAGREMSLEEAYVDDAIVTRTDARGRPRSSSSQPALMALMLEQLDVREGHRVLEIGAGTGYNAALLAELVGPDGHVTSIDVDPEISAAAARALAAEGMAVRVVDGDGRLGDPAGAPYDRIMVTASAEGIPAAWRDQLREGGRLQVPLRLDPAGAAIQVIPVLERRGHRLRSVALTWGGFMPLHGGDGGYATVPTLSAELAAGGKRSMLVTLVGGGVAGLSEPFARWLLGALLSDTGEAVREGTTPMSGRRTPLLVLYLLLSIAPERRVSLGAGARMGVGLVDLEHGGLGLLALPSPWEGRGSESSPRSGSGSGSGSGDSVPWRLLRFGDGRAAEVLDELLDGWDTLAAAGEPRLTITAGGASDPLELSFGWVERSSS